MDRSSRGWGDAPESLDEGVRRTSNEPVFLRVSRGEGGEVPFEGEEGSQSLRPGRLQSFWRAMPIRDIWRIGEVHTRCRGAFSNELLPFGESFFFLRVDGGSGVMEGSQVVIG